MLRYQANLQAPTNHISKVSSIAISPNMKRIAVANADKIVALYDENFVKKDKIATKAAEKNSKNYIIRAIEFSPDSTILAVAQSDSIIYGYKIGAEWGEKKSICTKILTNSSITCMNWPKGMPHEIFFGTADGQVKIGYIKNHKAQTLYSTNSYVVSICSDKNSKFILTGHLDCTIYIYNIESQTFKKLTTAGSVPYALGFGKHIAYAGNDGIVTFIDKNSNIIQKFDYTTNDSLRDFTGAYFNPIGENLVLANYSRFLIFNYDSRNQEWIEKGFFDIQNYYTITAGCWKPDGTKFFTGNLCGSVDVLDISIKKMKFKGKFELSYISPSKVKIVSLEKGTQAVITSNRGLEIVKIDIVKDRYVIAETSNTLLLGDIIHDKSSEIEWIGSGNEKFEFTDRNICWITNAGEISVVEFGVNEILGNFRTEYVSRGLISAVIKQDKDHTKKFIAYLLDLHTICILNLHTRITEATIDHDCTILSLSFNCNGTKLLFKDKKRGLYLFNLLTGEKQTLLTYSGFYGWIPDSDVIVAQNKESLNVWYSSDSPDKKTTIPVKGTVSSIKCDKKIGVIVQDGNIENFTPLDDLLIKFGYALENKELGDCLAVLENRNDAETEGHWRTLLRAALDEQNYFIVERCYAGLKDMARAKYFRKINNIIRKLIKEGETMESAVKNYEVQARLAMLEGHFIKAENIYLEKEEVEKAIQMYQDLHKWDDSLRIAEKMRSSDYETLKNSYYDWLIQTGQEAKAAEIKEKEGNYVKAIELYLTANLPVKAVNIIIQYGIQEHEDIVAKTTQSLTKMDNYDKIGELHEHYGNYQKALEYYDKGKAYSKAIDLAKRNSPELITALHEKWGDFLMAENQKENAIYHFIEAGAVIKAVEAAISARQWSKAIQLLSSLSDSENIYYCVKIAEQLEESKQYELAEKYYIKADKIEESFKMYIKHDKVKDAIRVVKDNMKEEDMKELLIKYAKSLESEGDCEMAEKLYIEIKKPELAIKMYKTQGNWDRMLRLFAYYRPENLKEAHLLIARKLEEEGNYEKAKQHYIETGMWSHAVDMYEKRRMFEDCIRICKNYASDRDTVERAKRWGEIIGEHELIKLLKKTNLTDSLIDYLCEKAKFEEAFKVADTAKHKLADVHLSYAMHLEDEKRYKEAEQHYLQANKYDQVVSMYLDIRDYHLAIAVASQHDPALLPSIYIQQGNDYYENGDLEKMEMCFINAGKPELAVNAFAKMGNYGEALRIARKHCPHLVTELTHNMQTIGNNIEDLNGEQLLQQAKLWEDNRDWEKALEVYLEITTDHFDNHGDLERIWDKAVQIAYNFVKNRYAEVVKIVCKRLREINSFELAADYYLGINMYEEAVKCYVAANSFDRARHALKQVADPEKEEELKNIVDLQFKKYLKSKGDAEQLVGHEAVKEGLEVMIERGDWAQALTVAKSKSQELLEFYLIKFINSALTAGKFSDIVSTLTKFGMPQNPAHLNLYRKIITETLSISEQKEVSELKSVLYNFMQNMDPNNFHSDVRQEFERYMLASHLIQLQGIYRKHDIKSLYVLTTLSIVRFADVLSMDKPFHEAGTALKESGNEVQAFMFFNRYLDIFDYIEDPNNNYLEDNEEFKKTDFPALEKLAVPTQNMITDEERNQIRDWLLQVSIKRSTDLKLETRSCMNCSQNIYHNNLECPFCEYKVDSCSLTGAPIDNSDSTNCKHCRAKFNNKSLKEYTKHFSHCPWCSKNL